MTLAPFSHVCLLVTDLDAAIERLSATLGVTFNAPVSSHFDRVEDPHPHELDFRGTYSREGPPYIELVEATGDGIFSAAHGEGVHHVGYWAADTRSAREEMAARGVHAEASMTSSKGGLIAWYSDPDALCGTRFEFVDESVRKALEAWISRGAPLPDL